MSLCGNSSCISETSGGLGVASSAFAAALQLLVTSQCLLTEPWPKQAHLQNGSSVDVIIVGSGSAGSALAARLVETNLTVLLLEAGGDPPLESIVPGFRGALLKSPYDWNYTTTNDHYSSQELAHQRQRLRLGRVLGGSGSINVNIYSRGFPADFDDWAREVRDSTWSWDNVLPYFKKTEKLTDKTVLNHPPSLKYHGTEGEIEVAGVEELNSDTIQLMNAFKELGFKIVEDRNNPDEIGAYHMSFTIKDGKKHSSLTAMLNKVADKDNLYVMKNAFVTKVLTKENAAYGVKVLIDDKEWEFYAKKEVIVSAGAYNTPKLLMLSGIGPREHLQQHGINVVKNLPVGNALQDHFSVYTFIATDGGTCSPLDADFEVIKYLYNHTGILSVPSRMGVDYALKDSPIPNVPDFGIYSGCLPKGSRFYAGCLQELSFTSDTCRYLDSLLKNHELISLPVLQRKPKSKGVVRLSSSNPLDKPIIRSNAFTHADDLENFYEAIEVAWSLKNTSYFKSKNAFIVDLKLKSCEGLEGPEYVKCMVRSVAHSESHATGTAAMGSVVDSRLRVLGVDGLRVVDASVMPSVPSANINAAVIMVAEKAAEFIKQQYGLNEHNHHRNL